MADWFSKKDITEEDTVTLELNRFVVASSRIARNPEFDPPNDKKAPYGYYKGRHIIGEQTLIEGGVFVSALPYEAIVVDSKYEPLNNCYTELLTNYAQDHGTSRDLEGTIMRYLLDIVRMKISYAPRNLESLLESKNIEADQKTSLSFFIEHGIGAARHQVLLFGYLLERLKSAHYINGHIFLNYQIDINSEEDEAATYTSPSKESFVFRPHEKITS